MGVILIAFEREAELSALDQLLSGKGHRVVRSGNGLAALDAARREPPHAIVSDIVLPRMDGFALCRKWKQDERLQSIPFLFYTRRHDDPKYERFALELGAERFLARSVSPDSLVTALDELLARHAKNGGGGTMPLPALDETVVQRRLVAEKAQRAAEVEKSQRAAEAAEKAQRAAEAEKAARLAEAEKAQRLAELEKAQHLAELDSAQRKQTEAAERAQQAQARLLSQIEELEATNRRLAAGEARFRRVFEANPLPMWIADRATGGFIAVNDAALALFGYSRAEFLALQGAALEAPDAEDGAAVAHRRKDGSALSVALALHEIEFDGRSADLVSAYDLTEHAATERKLRDEAAGLRKEVVSARTLVEAAPDGCWSGASS
jgi:CheY-like chemotaxis protein/PAS domain-containing protein